MKLGPREIDKLLLHQAGSLAQKRYSRGVLLNYPETIALIASQVLEFIRDGDTVATLMNKGKQIIGLNEVMPGIAELVDEVQVEGTFPDGTKLVTVHYPICKEWGDESLALYSSGLTRTNKPTPLAIDLPVPGELIPGEGDIEINANRETLKLEVLHHGDRPVQVGSHYPFFEVNAALEFDREKAIGFRLDIPSGTAVRFEPGETKIVDLVAIGGNKKIYGGNALVSGSLDEIDVKEKVSEAVNQGFKHKSGEAL